MDIFSESLCDNVTVEGGKKNYVAYTVALVI